MAEVKVLINKNGITAARGRPKGGEFIQQNYNCPK